MSNRKRNRDGAMAYSVSDDDAMAALMSSAEARQRQRDEQSRKNGRRESRPNNGREQGKKNARDTRRDGRPDDNYYGPAVIGDGEKIDATKNEEDNGGVDKEKPNFGLSGALAKDEDKGNIYKGVVLKFSEPPEARAPNTQWRLYVFKGDETVETLHISKQSAYLLGRNEDIADIPLRHGSCSSQHAVLQYRALPEKKTGRLQCSPYIMDLDSTNGSFINGVKIDSARYYQLKKGDTLKFGASTREYVILTASTTTI